MHPTPLLIMALLGGSAPTDAATVTVEGRDSAAIAAAIERSQAGDTVDLPAGTYAITGPVAPKSGTRLIGAGRDQTILRFAGEKPGPLVSLAGCADVTVCNLTLDGAENPLATAGIAAYDAQRLQILRVGVRNLVPGEGFGPHGIHFTGDNPGREHGVTDSLIANCDLENIGVGAAFGCGIRLSWGSCRNEVGGCRIARTGRGGIFGDNGSTDLVIRGNTVGGSGGEMLGIEVWGGCDRSVIEDNRIDHWLSIGGCDWCAARRNTISATDGTFGFCGIEAIGSYLVVTDNLVDDGQVIGLSVSGAQPKQYVYYGNDTFRRCTQWGAQLQGETGAIAYQYLYRCRFVGTTAGRGKVWYPGDDGHGFRINGNTRDLVCEECVFADNARDGVQVTVGDVDLWSFLRCTIRGNQGPAVAAPDAVNAVEWVDCTVEGNGTDALPAAKPFPMAPPVAAFEAPDKVRVGEPAGFRSTSRPGEGKVVQALWDLGDGPPLVGDEVTHTYGVPGEYRVTPIVWDSAGRGARAERVVVVRP